MDSPLTQPVALENQFANRSLYPVAVTLLSVASQLNIAQDGGIGGGATNLQLFQLLNQRAFAVASRRSAEGLSGDDFARRYSLTGG